MKQRSFVSASTLERASRSSVRMETRRKGVKQNMAQGNGDGRTAEDDGGEGKGERKEGRGRRVGMGGGGGSGGAPDPCGNDQ